MIKKIALGFAVVSMSLLFLAITPCYSQDKAPADQKGATYVGAEKCRECHERTFEGWKTTVHPYKFQEISPDNVVADFAKNNTLKTGDYTSKMVQKGNEYFVTTIGPDGKEATYKAKYTIGSVWKQRFVTEFPNGALHILPVQWNVKTQEWVDYHGLKKQKPGDGKYWSDKVRTYQFKCSGCHNTGTQFSYNKETDTFNNTQWSDMGVACEACHGPGSKHIKAEGRDLITTIVNPAKLYDRNRATMVCGQCHTRGSSATKLQDTQKTGYPHEYEVGGNLNYAYDELPGVNPDGSSRQHHQQYIDYKKSAHYETGVMCWDCHYVHRQGTSNSFQTKLPGSFLCKNCHIDVEKKGVHGIHSTNDCLGCHMPPMAKSATPGDVKSHSFQVVMPHKTIELGKKQANSCNLCHYHKDDKPEDLARVIDSIKKKSWDKYK